MNATQYVVGPLEQVEALLYPGIRYHDLTEDQRRWAITVTRAIIPLLTDAAWQQWAVSPRRNVTRRLRRVTND